MALTDKEYVDFILKDLARNGGKVFPIWLKWDAENEKFEKIPLTKWSEASSDKDQIKDWFIQKENGKYGPEARWWSRPAVARQELNNELTVDVDVRNDGIESLQNLCLKYKDLKNLIKETQLVQTASGGLHIKWNNPKEYKFVNSSRSFGKEYPGIDLRTKQGVLVIPPSDNYIYLNNLARQEVPEILWKLHQEEYLPTDAEGKPLKFNPREYDLIEDGTRNSTIFRMASSMWGQGYSAQAITKLIQEENELRCLPPIDSKELNNILKSVFERDYGDFAKSPKAAVNALLKKLSAK